MEEDKYKVKYIDGQERRKVKNEKIDRFLVLICVYWIACWKLKRDKKMESMRNEEIRDYKLGLAVE